MRTAMIGLALAALAVAAVGCDAPRTRAWSERASIVEIGVINASACWPPDVERLSPEQVEAFGVARVRCYEAWGGEVKAAVESLKDK